MGTQTHTAFKWAIFTSSVSKREFCSQENNCCVNTQLALSQTKLIEYVHIFFLTHSTFFRPYPETNNKHTS